MLGGGNVGRGERPHSCSLSSSREWTEVGDRGKVGEREEMWIVSPFEIWADSRRRLRTFGASVIESSPSRSLPPRTSSTEGLTLWTLPFTPSSGEPGEGGEEKSSISSPVFNLWGFGLVRRDGSGEVDAAGVCTSSGNSRGANLGVGANC